MDRKVRGILIFLVMVGLLFWQQVIYGGVSYAEEEVTNEETETEETETEETENPVECYELSIPEPDGACGYYVSSPEITITHVSMTGITCCQMRFGDHILVDEKIQSKGQVIHIPEGTCQEGENILHIWMEDEEGNKLDEYEKEIILSVDMTPPVLAVSAPNGFETWYQDDVAVFASAEDFNSQPESISCVAGGQVVDTVSGSEASFLISQASVGGAGVPILVSAIDKAGNRSEEHSVLYIDRQNPQVSITGLEDHMITSQPVDIECVIEEENVLQIQEATLQIEYPDGSANTMTPDAWEDLENRKYMKQTLEQDGIYRIFLSATDLSGRHTELNKRVIIDQENPVIQAVNEVDGQYYQVFQWEKPVETWIHDFTSYTYSILMDGELYRIGTDVWEEGWHILEVEATDAAKNQGTAKARFKVDHTAPEVVFHHLEEGESCEEEANFQISLKEPEDKIDTIRINGEKKELYGTETVCDYRISEPGNYEVTVEASDRAGNTVVSHRLFQVVKKKNIAGKVFRYIKNELGLEKESNEKRMVTETTKNQFSYSGWFVLVLMIFLVFGILLYKKKHP